MDVALCNIAGVHLHVRQRGPVDAVPQGIACISKAGRVHDQPVKALVDCPINTVDRFALDVGIENDQLVAAIVSMTPQPGVEFSRSCRATDFPLAPPRQSEICALHQQNLRH